MRGKDLERFLAEVTPRSASHLDQIGRALRDAGFAPSGARGPHAPHFDTKSAANFLIAVMATAQSAADPIQSLKQFAELVPLGKPFQKVKTFGETVAALLDLTIYASDVAEIMFYHPFDRERATVRAMPIVAIVWKESSGRGRSYFVPADRKSEFTPSGSFGSSTMHDMTTIGGELLYEIGTLLRQPDLGRRLG